MTLHRRQARECERARALGSQALDGPLSDLELRRLDAHLAECQACDEAVGAMTELTARLRTAPGLVGSVAAVPVRPARRRASTALQVAGIAAVVAAFAGLGALVASPSGASPPQAPRGSSSPSAPICAHAARRPAERMWATTGHEPSRTCSAPSADDTFRSRGRGEAGDYRTGMPMISAVSSRV